MSAARETVYRAVADPTRRAILDVLREGDLSAGDLAGRFPISRPAVSKHLRILREADLVQERRDGRSRIYRLHAKPLGEIDRWLTSYRTFWAARLHDLKRYVEGRGDRPREDGPPSK